MLNFPKILLMLAILNTVRIYANDLNTINSPGFGELIDHLDRIRNSNRDPRQYYLDADFRTGPRRSNQVDVDNDFTFRNLQFTNRRSGNILPRTDDVKLRDRDYGSPPSEDLNFVNRIDESDFDLFPVDVTDSKTEFEVRNNGENSVQHRIVSNFREAEYIEDVPHAFGEFHSDDSGKLQQERSSQREERIADNYDDSTESSKTYRNLIIPKESIAETDAEFNRGSKFLSLFDEGNGKSSKESDNKFFLIRSSDVKLDGNRISQRKREKILENLTVLRSKPDGRGKIKSVRKKMSRRKIDHSGLNKMVILIRKHGKDVLKKRIWFKPKSGSPKRKEKLSYAVVVRNGDLRSKVEALRAMKAVAIHRKKKNHFFKHKNLHLKKLKTIRVK
ncbi:Uncharacterised protein g1306 [Pycnogonum litorale]